MVALPRKKLRNLKSWVISKIMSFYALNHYQIDLVAIFPHFRKGVPHGRITKKQKREI